MIDVVPKVMPLTIPVEPTVAADVLLLLHVPPDVASVNAKVNPWQTTGDPVITENGLTVTAVVAIQPVGSE